MVDTSHGITYNRTGTNRIVLYCKASHALHQSHLFLLAHIYCSILTRTLILSILHVGTPLFLAYTLYDTIQYAYYFYSNAVSTPFETDFEFGRYTPCDVCEHAQTLQCVLPVYSLHMIQTTATLLVVLYRRERISESTFAGPRVGPRVYSKHCTRECPSEFRVSAGTVRILLYCCTSNTAHLVGSIAKKV